MPRDAAVEAGSFKVSVNDVNIITDSEDTSDLSFDTGDVTVTLTTATDGAKIYCTVNEEIPTRCYIIH